MPKHQTKFNGKLYLKKYVEKKELVVLQLDTFGNTDIIGEIMSSCYFLMKGILFRRRLKMKGNE